jgi:hypothetical protein
MSLSEIRRDEDQFDKNFGYINSPSAIEHSLYSCRKNSVNKVKCSHLWGRATIESGHGNTPLTSIGILSALLVSIESGIGLLSLNTMTSKTDCMSRAV